MLHLPTCRARTLYTGRKAQITTSRFFTISRIDAPPSRLGEISSCPPPSCPCATTPEGLDIKRDGPMSIPPYAAHIIIRTGRVDWSSRIEDDVSKTGREEPGVASNLAKTLKEMLGPGGKYYLPGRSYLISNSNQSLNRRQNSHSLYIWPHNIVFPSLRDNKEDIEHLIKEHLLPPHPDEPRAPEYREKAVQKTLEQHSEANFESPSESHISSPFSVNDAPLILVCSHRARDSRCGTMGPILEQGFTEYISKHLTDKMTPSEPDKRTLGTVQGTSEVGFQKINLVHQAAVASISHIGGHAWAGNVIIYFPRKYKLRNSFGLHPLTGRGVWYGRVEPKHVEGIVEETVKQGTIIRDLLRGIKAASGENIIED